jgi:hypothetical protein
MAFGIKFGQRKRKYRRAGVPGFVADFADGNRIIGGIVENVSTGGFEIVNLPKSFIAEKLLYTVVLSGGGKHYKMLVKPCWRKQKGLYNVIIGFKIVEASWEWMQLTMHEIAEIQHNKNSG